MTMSEPNQYLTIKEAANLLRLTQRSIYNLIERKSIKKVKIRGSKRTLLSREDLEKLLEKE